ncbi:MAG: hypothetical protein FWB86_04380 [Treponema sp.]|nr:hypothetical protein [Treponema sp.]MCL2250291.1 hypothetical protein [Treponema sp.]
MDKGHKQGLQATGLLQEAYEKLKASDAAAACSLLEEALDLDYENTEIKHALKCVNWWLENSRRIDELKTPYEKGAYLISLLKPYYSFLGQLNEIQEINPVESYKLLQTKYERCQYTVRYFVYSQALFFFEGLLSNPSNQHDTGLLLYAGRCNKGLGNYDEALFYLEQAFNSKMHDAQILAELADVNALLAQMKPAKALFKEAFFIDPAKIDLNVMESALILNLSSKVSEMGFKDEALCEWIPVYGHLWKVFSVQRELKQIEAGRLKQSIFSLEAEYEANPARRELIKPRLLNHYFWLIDYYEAVKEESSHIEDTLLKIQLKDPEIYNIYTG